ncbi:hypothetical protein ANCDUO_15358 [Ancylostoma duodenale]|uniref:Uncharacterized protein n=1 Tax=Ancylostoma duodenale TaxID=51022 RepID=A0A0C2G0R0_9BILA|nr:hypothetical protein ANCDUO_15358 [Ancylostoma duodenale]
MGGEVYLTPDANIDKSAKQQVDETLNGMISHGMPITRLWIKARKRTVGIITNSKIYYKLFTGLYNYVANDRIWYTNPEPVTCNGQEVANFDDFKPFAGWVKPSAKQLCVAAKECGITINRNIVKPGYIWIPPERKDRN